MGNVIFEQGWYYREWNKLNPWGSGSYMPPEAEHNGLQIYNMLSARGWTVEAICGLLGNACHESFLNPAQVQVGYKMDTTRGGFGLVQWTPKTNWSNWASKENHSVNSGYWQTYCIDTEENIRQYYRTSSYPLSYAEFKASTETPEYLVRAFFANYERGNPAKANMPRRIAYANWWYERLTGVEPSPTPDPDPDPYNRRRRKYPLWMLIKYPYYYLERRDVWQ